MAERKKAGEEQINIVEAVKSEKSAERSTCVRISFLLENAYSGALSVHHRNVVNWGTVSDKGDGYGSVRSGSSDSASGTDLRYV